MPYICPTAMRKKLSYTRDYILIANFIGDDGTENTETKLTKLEKNCLSTIFQAWLLFHLSPLLSSTSSSTGKLRFS